ncbi:MAG: NAD(P)H:quinone oxidoreductase [Gammaproteobacteria bacterium]|nr:NAD(P)H:quinone oxidoreductase [Gammaproteobacteria bacterium]MBT8132969.1 NAD(P)H:quinone oxidoreductase [Gammaproteobacteria bacterium]NNJ49912.1 NAD(P)H:quinone oxidoreductase [Gammaproteobacteria bacterium]
MPKTDTAAEILVLYYSPGGTTAEMANIIARGIEEVEGAQARIRTVPAVSANTEQTQASIPEEGPLYATIEDLEECDGLVLGCPTHYGNMPAAMKYFIDGTSALWMGGKLAGKPAAVFSASTSMHGGQESTLLTMMLPLLHHGMLIVGLPYTETELFQTKTGGSPYGATRLTDDLEATPLSDEERKLCLAIGKRVATTAKKLLK